MRDVDGDAILPWLVLGFFAGFRPSEAARLNWDEIVIGMQSWITVPYR